MPPRIPIEALEQIGFVDHAEGICVAPDGTVYLVMRLYWPKDSPPSILPPGEGTWKPPGIMASK